MERKNSMNKKSLTSILTILLIVAILFTSQNKPSYSLEENSPIQKIINLNLEYTNNETILKNNLYNFINEIDDTLIPLYEYNEDLSLNDNYQFMTTFALNFISNHLDYYQNRLISKNVNQPSADSDNITATTKYVPIDLIYEITSLVFNRRYYHITNPELTVTDNAIPLLVESYPIEMNLDNIINISKNNNTLLVNVKYQEMDFYYQYEFLITNKQLTLKNLNIEV